MQILSMKKSVGNYVQIIIRR